MVVIVVGCISFVVAFFVVVVLSETVMVVASWLVSAVVVIVVLWMCWTVNGSVGAIDPLALVVMYLVSIECFVCRVVARAFGWIVDW